MKDLNLRDFDRIVFFTGAGLSAESGIPTYRGKGGLWHEYNYEDYACQRAFDANPEKVWDFHAKRREFIGGCSPNAGHLLISEIEQTKPESVVITQNIDGLHQRAGSTNIIELHGSIWRVRCDREHRIEPNTDIPMKTIRCQCGAYLRPDIVWFEDPLKQEAINQAVDALQSCDIFLSIGTSGVVYPAAQLPYIAMQRQVPTVEINIEDTPLTQSFSFQLRGPASSMLEQLWSP